RGVVATGNFFGVLGVRAGLGRLLTPEDDRLEGAHPVLVVGHDLWRGRFAADKAIVGREVRVNGEPYTVVGVAPEGFRGANALEDIQLYVPMAMQASLRPLEAESPLRRDSRWLSLIARLRPGMGLDPARMAVQQLARELQVRYPDSNRNQIASLFPTSRIGPRAYPALRLAAGLLMSIAAVVLFVATSNVANLLLARAVARRREIALRLALGCSRGRLVRQLLIESLLLA